MAHMFLPLCGSIQHDRLPPARSTHSPSSLFLPAQGMQHSRASPAPPTQKDMVGVGWAGDPVLLPPQVPQPQSCHIPAAYTGTLGSLGVLGPARTMGRKGLILWQGVSMEPGNCQPWVFCLQDWICSPCLHLSGAVVVRDMRAWRVCQAGYPISADLEVQGKLSSVSVGPAGAQCCVLDSHGMGAGLSLGSPQDPVQHTKGITYPCFLWVSSAPLSTTTCPWGHVSAPSPQQEGGGGVGKQHGLGRWAAGLRG